MIVNDLKLLGYAWFCGRSNIGIVLCEDQITKEKKSYIGTVPGQNQDDDLRYLIEWGSKFDPVNAEDLINKYGSQTA